uniref:Uncharacterized protein n=1 Tax=Arion vulgaris TaxID=1028688 RepID=A0A0B6ZTB8_9EUPU
MFTTVTLSMIFGTDYSLVQGDMEYYSLLRFISLGEETLQSASVYLSGRGRHEVLQSALVVSRPPDMCYMNLVVREMKNKD